MDKWYCIVAVIGLLLTNFSTNNGAVVDVGQFDNTEVSEEDALQLVRLLNGSGDVSPIQQAFTSRDCGSSSSLVRIRSLSVQPDPISLPGTLTVAFSARVSANLPNKISVDLKIWKKILIFWVYVPCMFGVGSCTYNDVCPLLPCPPSFVENGIPCQCPIQKGDYNLPQSPVYINFALGGLLSGPYKMNARFHSEGINIGCVEAEVSIR